MPNNSTAVKLHRMAGQCMGAWSVNDAGQKEEAGAMSCGQPVGTTEEGRMWSPLWWPPHPACQEVGQTLKASARHLHPASNLTPESSAVFSTLSFLFSEPSCRIPHLSPSLKYFT